MKPTLRREFLSCQTRMFHFVYVSRKSNDGYPATNKTSNAFSLLSFGWKVLHQKGSPLLPRAMQDWQQVIWPLPGNKAEIAHRLTLYARKRTDVVSREWMMMSNHSASEPPDMW